MVLIVLVVLPLLLAPAGIQIGLLLVLATLCAREWGQLSGLVGGRQVIIFTLAVLSIIVAVGYFSAGAWPWLWSLATIVWLAMALPLIGYRQDAHHRGRPLVKAAVGLLLICAALLAAWWLLQQVDGSWLLAGVLLICAAVDIGAYAGGKSWGKSLLLPQVSPGKTRVGLLTGLMSGIAVASVMGTLSPPGWQLAAAMLLGIPFAVLGDLSVSLFKRWVGVKDSGRLLPGHGGVVDRLDSILAVLPPCALLIWWLTTA